MLIPLPSPSGSVLTHCGTAKGADVTDFDSSTVVPAHSAAIATVNGALESAHSLRRILRLRDLVFMVMGTVIGSGIFLVPGAVLRAVSNSVPLALSVWLAGGVLSLLGALTYGELTAMKPQAGGLYVFIRDGYGALTAFLFGWTVFFVISSGSVATLAVAFSNYLNELVHLSPLNLKIVAVLMILIVTVVNVLGTRKSANLLNVTTAIKISALVLVSTLLCCQGKHSVLGEGTFSGHPAAGITGFGLAMISVLWAYEGWQYATYCAGETVDAQKTFPLAFLIGTTGLIAIYMFANLGYLRALGTTGVAASSRVAATSLGVVMAHGAGKIIAVAILISMFSAANALILNAPRVCYAMAKDGLFFKALSRVHPSFGTPAVAVCAAGLWSSVLAASGTFEQLLTYVVFVGWIFYALAAASIFRYRKRFPDVERPYRVPFYPWTPLLFIAAALALVANTIATQPVRAAVGIGIVILGVPVYAFWRRSGRRGAGIDVCLTELDRQKNQTSGTKTSSNQR
jgi:APA family basic amino acid/polyamine antiporter